MFVSWKHFAENLEINTFDDTTLAEEQLFFNKENMEFWVINICFFTIKEYSVHGL